MSWCGLLGGLLWAAHLGAQWPLKPEDAARVADLINADPARESLSCDVEHIKPFLDFAFRFEAGYVVRCPLKQFGGVATKLTAIMRVRPSAGTPSIFGEHYELPAIPEDIKDRVNLRHVRAQAEFSGVVALGEGEYAMDLFVVDDRNRAFKRSWEIKAAPHGDERKAESTMKPGMVAALALPFWEQDRESSASRFRLSVLLNASPINPLATKLRAWDRAFLLDSLYSLLRQIPSAHVRIVAFNLDQQREIFRQERLDRFTFVKLSHALRELELGTIPYGTLRRQRGWTELLNGLVKEEAAEKPNRSAIVFLGPHTRMHEKLDCQALNHEPAANPPIYYFEYFAGLHGDFPDSIDYLTNACSGRVFKLHSPGELGKNIAKMRADLQNNPAVATARPE